MTRIGTERQRTSRPSATAKVHDRLESDVVLAAALGRGILSLRGTARWLIDNEGWDVSEEAVVSALRRHESREADAGVDEGYELLQSVPPQIRTGLALWQFPSGEAVPEEVRDALEGRGLPDQIAAGEVRGTFTYLVEEGGGRPPWPADADTTPERIQPVSMFRIAFDGEERSWAHAASVLLGGLAHRSVPVVGFLGSNTGFSLLVPDAFQNRVQEVLRSLGKDT